MKALDKDANDVKGINIFLKNYVLKELAILDFRPLPCTDLNTWKYGGWTDIPEL